MKLEEARKLKDALVDLSVEEWMALEHVHDRIKEDGSHDVNGCPYPTRARCQYRHLLTTIEAKGLKVPTR